MSSLGGPTLKKKKKPFLNSLNGGHTGSDEKSSRVMIKTPVLRVLSTLVNRERCLIAKNKQEVNKS